VNSKQISKQTHDTLGLKTIEKNNPLKKKNFKKPEKTTKKPNIPNN